MIEFRVLDQREELCCHKENTSLWHFNASLMQGGIKKLQGWIWPDCYIFQKKKKIPLGHSVIMYHNIGFETSFKEEFPMLWTWYTGSNSSKAILHYLLFQKWSLSNPWHLFNCQGGYFASKWNGSCLLTILVDIPEQFKINSVMQW